MAVVASLVPTVIIPHQEDNIGFGVFRIKRERDKEQKQSNGEVHPEFRIIPTGNSRVRRLNLPFFYSRAYRKPVGFALPIYVQGQDNGHYLDWDLQERLANPRWKQLRPGDDCNLP